MDIEQEAAELNPAYDISVSYNDPVVVADRKKGNIIYAILCMVGGAIMGAFAYFSTTGEDPSALVMWLFIAMAGFCVVSAIVFLCLIKPSKKNDSRSFQYIFFEDAFRAIINKPNKEGTMTSKTILTCLYERYEMKQYIANITELPDRFLLKVLVGYNNMVPQYRAFTIPKTALESEEKLNEFITFLKERVGQNYVVKEK